MVVLNHGPRELAMLDKASRMLADAKSLDEIKTVRDKAEAARTYVKAARLGLELQNRAAEVKLRAERKAGEFLKSLKLRGGDRRSKRHDAPLKLEDLGISRDQSKRWQYVASVTEAEFLDYLKVMNDQKREITSAGLLRLARGKKPGKMSQGRSRNSRFTNSTRVATGSPAELVIELMNHWELLGNVLRPVYEQGSLELKNAERRVVGRLIGEMGELLSELQRTWSSPKRTQ